MNYIGSKRSLLPFLEKHILEFSGGRPGGVFCDLFSGTGVVGHHFKKLGFRIIANDIQYYSFCLSRASVGINREPTFSGISESVGGSAGSASGCGCERVLGYLNRLAGSEGFVYGHFCPGGTASTKHPRQYFTDENGKRCDAIRLQIESWRETGSVSNDEYFYLLAALIRAVDEVANTASIYGAFLKHIKPSARKPLTLKPVEIVPAGRAQKVFNEGSGSLVDRLPYDILYLDPPYNHRQYCTNYHVLETIARYDSPCLRGVTGLREYRAQKSDLCSRGTALGALADIVRRTPAAYVYLSYNNEGLVAGEDIGRMMGEYGQVDLRTTPRGRFRADVDGDHRKYKADGVTEYLFCLRKTRGGNQGHGRPAPLPSARRR